jgi:hypothetical protein
LVNDSLEILIAVKISDAAKTKLTAILKKELKNDTDWKTLWETGEWNIETKTENKLLMKLRLFLCGIMHLPEYQMM